jgi:hypothetical protein
MFFSVYLVPLLLGILSCEALYSVSTENTELWRVYDNALPADVFSHVHDEALRVFEHIRSQNTLRYGKRLTFWMDMESKPRTNIEVAIQKLSRYISGGNIAKNYHKRNPPIGAEWWVQVIDGNGGEISFHYDKDEGLASQHLKMRHPLLSTVTYLTGHGSPTVVFNQTSPDGNVNDPALPTHGIMSYPVANRHLVFRGDLNHGVVGSLDESIQTGSNDECASDTEGNINQVCKAPRSEKRVTLLINWWDTIPRMPNTRLLHDDLANELSNGYANVVHDKSSDGSSDSKANALGRQVAFPVLKVQSAEDDAMTLLGLERHTVRFAPAELFFFHLPSIHSFLEETRVHEIHWDETTVAGQVQVLDLNNNMQVSALFKSHSPTALILHAPFASDKERRKVYDALIPMLQRYRFIFDFYLCPSDDSCADAHTEFAVNPDDLMRLVVHVTHTDRKYVSSRMDPATVTSQDMITFLERFLDGVETERVVNFVPE